jgi:diguanylate cyclase (GGDEF)-like protein
MYGTGQYSGRIAGSATNSALRIEAPAVRHTGQMAEHLTECNMKPDARLQKLRKFQTTVCPGIVGFHADHLNRALEVGGIGVWQLDFTTGKLVVSDLCAAHFGRHHETDVASAGMLLATLHPDDQPRQAFAFKRALASGTELDIRCRSVWPEGSLHWIHMKGCIVSGSPLVMVGTSRDVTDEQRLEEDRQQTQAQMAYEAYHDPLTGLENRSRLDACLRQAVGQSTPFAVLYLDLDEFKAINDTMGHQVGDALLCHTATRLKTCIREQDTAGRYGGDEFVIIQMGAHSEGDAAQLARRIIDVLGEPYEIDGQTVEIGVSIGITMVKGRSRQVNEILKNADFALYRAKHTGKGTYRFSRPTDSCDMYSPAGSGRGMLRDKADLLQGWRRA